jgi:probable phosphoglycerate mutase
MSTRLLFVRHGETSYNASGRIQGRLDIPLNARGLEQAAAVGAALAGVPIGELYSSSLSRAREVSECAGRSEGDTN